MRQNARAIGHGGKPHALGATKMAGAEGREVTRRPGLDHRLLRQLAQPFGLHRPLEQAGHHGLKALQQFRFGQPHFRTGVGSRSGRFCSIGHLRISFPKRW